MKSLQCHSRSSPAWLPLDMLARGQCYSTLIHLRSRSTQVQSRKRLRLVPESDSTSQAAAPGTVDRGTTRGRCQVQQTTGRLRSGNAERNALARHVYHVYTLRSHYRDGLQSALQAEGIQTGVHYPVPVHLQPVYADLGYGRGASPNAEAAASQVLSLPLYPELSAEALAEVAAAVKQSCLTQSANRG